MAKFPNPPGVAHLRMVEPDYATIDAGTRLWRVHFVSGPFPTTWYSLRHVGPTDARFDHHEDPPGLSANQERGILYVAGDARTALAETFQNGRVIVTTRRDPWIAEFASDAPLKLLDLTGAFATRMGASMAIASGPKPRAQAWARQLYETFPDAQGIVYCSSMHANKPCFAINERGGDAIHSGCALSFHRALSDPGITDRIKTAAARLNYAYR